MQDQIDLSSFEDDDARAEALEALFEHRVELYKLQAAAQLKARAVEEDAKVEIARIVASRSFGSLTRTAIYVAGWAFFFSLILTPERQAQFAEWLRGAL